MTTILADTHVLLWLLHDDPRLGPVSRALAVRAKADNRLAVSAITFWEIAMLTVRGRLRLSVSVEAWRRRVLGLGVEEIAVCGDIGIAANHLDGFHRDPADRIITATALRRDRVLFTVDADILRWRGDLSRHDART